MSVLAYREAGPEDLPFIISSWLESFRTSRSAGLISMDSWRQVMEPQIRAILAREDCRAWVAYHPGEDDHRADLYGWIATASNYLQQSKGGGMIPGQLPLVIYVYTKAPYRQMGIARGLFKAAGITGPFNYACHTASLAKIIRKGKLPTGCEWQHMAVRFPPPK